MPTLQKVDMVAHACNPSTREVEAGGSKIKIIPGYTESLVSSWTTQSSPSPTQKIFSAEGLQRTKKTSKLGGKAWEGSKVAQNAEGALEVFPIALY